MPDHSHPRERHHFRGATVARAASLAARRASSRGALGANDRIRVGVAGTGGRARSLTHRLECIRSRKPTNAPVAAGVAAAPAAHVAHRSLLAGGARARVSGSAIERV
jgi:hypothetical protein